MGGEGQGHVERARVASTNRKMDTKTNGVLVHTIISAAPATEVPEYTDSIEWMDSTHTHLTHPTATVVPRS